MQKEHMNDMDKKQAQRQAELQVIDFAKESDIAFLEEIVFAGKNGGGFMSCIS